MQSEKSQSDSSSGLFPGEYYHQEHREKRLNQIKNEQRQSIDAEDYIIHRPQRSPPSPTYTDYFAPKSTTLGSTSEDSHSVAFTFSPKSLRAP